jgi:hypothetical protein
VGPVIGFLVSTGPIMHRYRELSWRVKGLITHQGTNRGGPAGVPSTASLIGNPAGLWGNGKTQFIGAGVVSFLFLVARLLNRSKLRSEPGWWATTSSLTAQAVMTFG